jgi:hypothetical protein
MKMAGNDEAWQHELLRYFKDEALAKLRAIFEPELPRDLAADAKEQLLTTWMYEACHRAVLQRIPLRSCVLEDALRRRMEKMDKQHGK